MQLRFRKIHPEAIEPQYQTAGAAGLDLHARIPHEIYLQPGVRFSCPTGIGIEVPSGFEAQVRARSGLSIKHGISLANGVGTVDADFRGEICALLINHGDQAFRIEPGMRIAQLVISPVVRVDMMREDALSDTARGEGGFGSTGA